MRKAIALLAVLYLTSVSPRSAAQEVPPCQSGQMQPVCIKTIGHVKIQIEGAKDGGIKRAIVFSDDMKRDSQDVLLATGAVMLSVNPSSTADERGKLLETMMVTGGGNGVKVWGGNAWKLSFTSSEAIRIIAEKLHGSAQRQIGAVTLHHTEAGSEMSVRSAMTICQIVDDTHLSSEPCEVSGWRSSISIRIDMNSGEARKACAAIVSISTRAGARFDPQWTVQIYSPYSGDHPIATCSFS